MRRDMKKLKRRAARLQPLDDPIDARRAERGKATQVVTFKEAAEAFNTCTSRNGATKSTERAPQLWEADTQKLVRLVRNYGIETVNAATMARGVHRANSCGTTRAPAQLADVVVPILRGP